MSSTDAAVVTSESYLISVCNDATGQITVMWHYLGLLQKLFVILEPTTSRMSDTKHQQRTTSAVDPTMLSPKRNREEKLPSKYFLKMMDLTLASSMVQLNVTLLQLQVKWRHLQSGTSHHQSQQNSWIKAVARNLLSVILEVLVQSKRDFYGSKEISSSQGLTPIFFSN